jgi:acyl-CoA thioester hydrolase
MAREIAESSVTLPVLWGDMDAFGHVNNTIYFRWFECGRIDHFAKIGFTQQMKDTGVGPILAWTDCRFRLPLTFPDTVTVETRVVECREDRFTQKYVVTSAHHGGVAAEGTGKIVCFNYKAGRPVALPEDIRAAITTMDNV